MLSGGIIQETWLRIRICRCWFCMILRINTVMELSLKILLALVALICLSGGINLLLKGAASFLPAAMPSPPIIDNLFRFLSGIYFGLGFLMAWVVFHLQAV